MNFLLLLLTSLIVCSEGYALRQQRNYLLITGCSRSGTTYIVKVLEKCGLDVKHEEFGKDGISSWMLTVDTDSVPWGAPRKGMDFVHIFHQVRHPLKVISSVSTEPPWSWNFIQAHVPQIRPEDNLTEKCAKFWYYWNLKAYKLAEWTYRIEDLENVWSEFQERLLISEDQTILKGIPKDTNTRNVPLRNLTWEDLKREINPTLYKNIRQLAQEYGYTD